MSEPTSEPISEPMFEPKSGTLPDPMTDSATVSNYPTPVPLQRRADIAVHIFGLALILTAGTVLALRANAGLDPTLILALAVYVLCALASNIASSCYHFSPWHHRRLLLRRIDHAAIYPSITATFTPFFLQAGTLWTITLLWLCWGLTAVAIWNKITNETIKTRWSTASYLALGTLGMSALPDLQGLPSSALWCVVAGATSYVIGTGFYARKRLPFRYAIWHGWVNIGGILMFIGIWLALF
ncbi:PAQR family membrane homeostasis protein TrhA [Pseudophaeobacter flagellatus]|uniref:PAQR family membrane homeostasis protein TrhA n=1 Tax=Pseudophaeobacter flagellatus TaxID=2899119 RepID=UPI002FCAAE84